MKQLHGNSFILGTAAFVFLATQPVWAQISQVTNVQLNPVNGGISVALKTSSGSRPQVFTTKRGNTLVADIINTQLRLPQGNSFRQDAPAPGIASVEVNQLDANSIRVRVTGSNNAPESQPVVRSQNGITLSFSPSTGTTASAPTVPASTAPTPTSPVASTPAQTGQKPDVLVPNPEVTIDGKPAQAAGPGQPLSQAPPFLPRAVAPPVGDIAISATDASPSTIDLGTQERVPRLVLRDAPVREVLSLLARAANLNLAYIGGEQGGTGQPGAAAQASSQTISLDIENEPVQDVFNYVLRLSGLEANRSNRTVFVGTKLPNATRDMVMRSLRLNQVTVGVALNFLVGLGAESAVSRERQVTSVDAIPVGTGVAPITQTQTTTETQVQPLRVDYKDSSPLLRGLQALGDERTNSVTLIGPPRLIEIAMAQLTQLDIRRRQVAVNVKIIDVNLNKTDDFNTSFSFGVDNTYFSNSNGSASLNFNNVSSFPRKFLANLTAQVQNRNAKILTDPTLIVQEGQTANVKLTQEVIGNIKNEITRGSDTSTQTITAEKAEVGLTLGVKIDRIDDNGFVSLSVAPVVKAPQSSEQIAVGENSQTIFLVSERSLNSGLVRLRDGQTLILSGIIQDEDRTTVSKIPILGDIPLIGALFRRTNKDNQRKEVIVLLTPQIMDDTENSSYGYNYAPSPEVRQILERRGLKIPTGQQ
ncbi:MAG: AMIN domain-containing protein [Nostoc sp. DedVER02]|uniref:AMIN domain-containing protein n=1 Tax=unclassified Nostoc TaxID=2593658 RepID=UPI002AD56C7D|nr:MULTISPECIES: AMIN domain-containing protein [unclassified Nostoc]MDZ7987394.1 AMIN domain-containing protein [Nostoc sp. DedVER02]MDZ8116628.1 AMIN domain-containing protein [Nostoc sp. DedVER01b]